MKTKHIINATANLMINVLNDHYVTYGLTIMSKKKTTTKMLRSWLFINFTLFLFFSLDTGRHQKEKTAPLPSLLLLSLFD